MKKTNKTIKAIKNFGEKIRQFFCIHKFEMTEVAKAIPSLELKDDESCIEIREHKCRKCETTRMLSQMIG